MEATVYRVTSVLMQKSAGCHILHKCYMFMKLLIM